MLPEYLVMVNLLPQLALIFIHKMKFNPLLRTVTFISTDFDTQQHGINYLLELITVLNGNNQLWKKKNELISLSYYHSFHYFIWYGIYDSLFSFPIDSENIFHFVCQSSCFILNGFHCIVVVFDILMNHDGILHCSCK